MRHSKKRGQRNKRMQSPHPTDFRWGDLRKAKVVPLGELEKSTHTMPHMAMFQGQTPIFEMYPFGGSDEEENHDVCANCAGNRRFSGGSKQEPESDQDLYGWNEVAEATHETG